MSRPTPTDAEVARSWRWRRTLGLFLRWVFWTAVGGVAAKLVGHFVGWGTFWGDGWTPLFLLAAFLASWLRDTVWICPRCREPLRWGPSGRLEIGRNFRTGYVDGNCPHCGVHLVQKPSVGA